MDGEYYKTKETVNEYIKLAEGFYGKLLINKLKKVLVPDSKLLEIGSGPGTDFNILSKTYNVVGSDNSLEFLNHLITQNPNKTFLELDAASLNTDQQFDGIYSNKVLHHLNDSELNESFKRQYEVLKPNGIICHSFWKGEGSEVFKGLFVNYHEADTLQEFYKKYFDLISIETYYEFEDDDSIVLMGRRKD